MKRSVRLRVCAPAALVAAALFCGRVSAQSTTIEVGLQPLSIVSQGEHVHVFHNQVDVNFNGEREQGDSPASWWILDAASGAVVDSMEFEWGFVGYPFRPYVDTANEVLYISHLGRVRSFALQTQELLDDTVAAYDASGIAVHGDHVYLSVRTSFTEPGQFVDYHVPTGQEDVRTVGVNPQQIVPFSVSDGSEGVLILSEGGFGAGAAPSVLDKHLFDGTDAPAPLELGATGNYIAVDGDYAYVAMNGSYEVVVVDIVNWVVIDSIAVVTSVQNGPRELVVLGDNLFVSTFDGDVRRYSISSEQEIDRFEPGGKPEGIALVDGRLWVTNAFKSSGFQSGSTIAVWDWTATSVTEEHVLVQATVAPSVVRDEAVITLPVVPGVPVDVAVVTADGRVVGTLTDGVVADGVYSVRFSPARFHLAAGRYFLRIATAAGVQAVPVHVVR